MNKDTWIGIGLTFFAFFVYGPICFCAVLGSAFLITGNSRPWLHTAVPIAWPLLIAILVWVYRGRNPETPTN